MAATAKPQAATTHPTAAAPQPLVAGTSSSSTRIVFIVGLVAVAVIFLVTVAGMGLWMWLGSDKEPNQNTATTDTTTNVNTRENVSIAGIWNCEFRSAYGTEHGPMVLSQNGSNVTGTVTTEEGQQTIVGTFDGQKFSFRLDLGGSPEWQLALSPDGPTMKGENQEFGTTKEMALCSR